ncbi:Flp pilus assembly protein CpaB [Ostreiculturibacter nitratireducens]|uniref:Flp pilus assembly protein CpaB n=1 Tax=Ostreiculturibacter nitratireducens TaxID=3075226 RepID=UPI0031B64FEB
MRIVFALVLLAGLGLAGFAVFMAQGYIEQIQAERDQLIAMRDQAPHLSDVVVAKKTMKYGDRITRDDLQTIKWPTDSLPAGVFNYIEAPDGAGSDVKAFFARGETRPRAALRSFEPFEPVLASKVTQPGVDAGINANLTPGMRAFAIRVDVLSGVSGFLRPGDRVDVYWTGRIGDSNVTKLIQTGVRLIAIDQNADADRTEETMIARTVTVEVTPEQVAALTQAQSTGSLTLSLVGSNDVSEVGPIEVDQRTLLGLQEEVVVAPEVKEVCTVRTNKGGEIVVVEIPCPD